MRKIQTVLAWLWLGVLGIAIGVLLWLNLTPKRSIPKSPARTEVTVYVPRIKGATTVYDRHAVPLEKGKNAYQQAFEYLILQSPEVPTGTRLRSVRQEGDRLVLDFSEAIQRNFSGGSDAEAALINAILQTAGTFPEIQKVQILVEGKPAETIGGHIDITAPLPVERNE